MSVLPTITPTPELAHEPAPEPTPARTKRSRPVLVARAAGHAVLAYLAALAVFGVFVAARGANPLEVYRSLVQSTLFSSASFQGVVVRATPLILAGLAVVVPARAGLLNVGGEGQIVIGAVAAAGVGLAADRVLPGGLVLVLMALAGALAGAAWAGLAALFRLTVQVNEAISTLLLNYVAIDVMLYLIYQPWKDPQGSGQPATRLLAPAARLPVLGNTLVHEGIIVAVVATLGVWLALRYTAWGFQLRVVGGNPEAARRAGLPTGWLILSSMLVGGALAGLGGMVHFAGAELKLRPGMTTGYGYVAFLAAFFARNHPIRTAGAALLLATILVGGDALQFNAGLAAATVNILMALILLVALGRSKASRSMASRSVAGSST